MGLRIANGGDPFERLERRKGYSLRSQRSWAEQRRLEAEQAKCKALIARCEENISRLEGNIKGLAASASQGNPMHPLRIADISREKDDEQRTLSAYKAHLASLRSQVKALQHPKPAQARERLAHQVQLGRHASERLALDRKIAPLLTVLCDLLKRRREIGAAMVQEAAVIDLQASPEALDATRFDDLLDAIPEDALAESERWAAWFAGETEAGGTASERLGMPALAVAKAS